MGRRPITVSNNPHPTHCTGIELILSIPTLFFLSLPETPSLPLSPSLYPVSNSPSGLGLLG